MATVSKGYVFGATESVTNAKLHSLIDDATVTGIVNADVDAGANIDASKLNLASSGYLTTGGNFTITGKYTFEGSIDTSGGFNLTDTSLTDVLGLIYPIGIVITLGVSTNPATLLGIGTWTAIEGRVIVGKASSGTFDTLDETDGAETHTLSISEMPGHTHQGRLADAGTDGAGAAGTGDSRRLTTGSTGGDAAHNNLQPYIVKYVWQRTS